MNDTIEVDIKPVNNNQFFIGVVMCSDSATYVVQVAPKGQDNISLVQGIPLASVFAANLGFKESLLPPPGSEVLCFTLEIGVCIIFGVIPTLDKNPTGGMMPSRAVIGGGDSTKDTSNLQGYYGDGTTKIRTLNANRPTDIRQGEYAVSNEFGVMMGLFQSFATLKGSELAQVQTFFLDDLVRIISHNFQHFTSMGEFKIYHDGSTLQMESGLSHDIKESLMCFPQINTTTSIPVLVDNKTPNKDDKNSFYGLAAEKLIGIERLKTFIGTLGDFINLLIVKPANDQIRALDGTPGKPDLGLSQVKFDLDGGVQIRSVKGIVLEKTNWIRVPTRVRAPEDPDGNSPDVLPVKESFKFNNEIKYQEQPFMYFLQMKDYLAYVNEELGYKNFKALDKDFAVNDNYSAEENLDSVTQVHPNHKVEYSKSNAVITIMPNGGIMLKDAWGSAIVMEGGSIYFQAAKDEVHQPMRSFIAKVGKVFNVAAKNDIDLSSTEGGFRLKTDKAQYLYSDNSGILLHAGGKDLFEVDPKDEAFTNVGGIIMHAPDTTVVSHSKYKFDRVDEIHSIHSKYIYAEADSQLGIFSGDRIDVYSGGDFITSSKGLLSMSTDGAAFLFGQSSTIVGMKDQTYGVAKFGAALLPVEGLLDTEGIKSFKDYEDQISKIHAQDFTPTFRDDSSFDDIKFRFLDTTGYGITPGLDYIPETILQQEEEAFGFNKLGIWTEKSINDTYPYPGADFANCLIKSTLQNIQNVNEQQVNMVSNLANTPDVTVGGNIFTDYKTL